MSTGLLLNITICFAITVSSFTFAWMLYRSKNEHSEKSYPSLKMLVILWMLVGSTYLPTTIRMIAAYFNNPEIDLLMYNIASVPFAFVSVPLVYFILYVIVGDKNISGFLSATFALFGVVYLGFLFSNGVIGPNVTEWSSLFMINSDIAINLYLIGLFVIPTAMVIGLLSLLILRRLPKKLRYRTTLPLVAISFVFDFMLTDFVTLVDEMQLAARIFILLGTVQAYLAYFPPMMIQEKLGIKEYSYEVYNESNDDDEQEVNDDV